MSKVIKNINGKKKLAVRTRPAVRDQMFVEISWTDGQGTRFMWIGTDEALAFAAEMALVAAIAKQPRVTKAVA